MVAMATNFILFGENVSLLSVFQGNDSNLIISSYRYWLRILSCDNQLTIQMTLEPETAIETEAFA